MPLESYAESVISIYADGDELEHIRARLVNIPSAHASTTWRGEWARFIAENLTGG